jgi:predicted RNA-binding Zn ribbon-like protein
MQIVNIEKRDRHYWRVTFFREGDEVSKWVRLGDLERKVYGVGDYDNHFRLNVLKAAREANRDLIVRKTGPVANVRELPGFNASIDELLTEEELAKLY